MKYNTREFGLSNSYYADYEIGLSIACDIPRPQIRRYLENHNTGKKKVSTYISIFCDYEISCTILDTYKEFVFAGGKDLGIPQRFSQAIKDIIEDKPISTALIDAFSQSTILEIVYRRLNEKSREKLLGFEKLTCTDRSTTHHYKVEFIIKFNNYKLEFSERRNGYSVCLKDGVGENIYSRTEIFNNPHYKETVGEILAQKLNEEFNKE